LLIHDKLEGIGWFSFETLRRITTQHPEDEFVFLFDRDYSEEFIFSDNVTPLIISPPARHPLLYYIWFNISLPPLLKKLKPDLFLSPDGYNCLPYKGKSLVVLHDLNFEHRPFDLPWLTRRYYQHFFPRFARHATRIATVSEYSKNDIAALYQVPADRIDVVYNGVNDSFFPSSPEQQKATRENISNGSPYFLFIGSLHPRKNLTNLFKAFDLFKKTDPNQVKLVIAGAKMWWTQEIRLAYESMEYKADVIFTGRISVDKLHNVIGAALALTYISHFEGFGIPILEAFACHTPVITSNTTSMPEVAGNAALLADPCDPEAIAEELTELATNKDLRNDLINKGAIRKNDFSWQKSADLLYESIKKTQNP
jgi:glycosyltransferase involved in cell wall biosynthesis